MPPTSRYAPVGGHSALRAVGAGPGGTASGGGHPTHGGKGPAHRGARRSSTSAIGAPGDAGPLADPVEIEDFTPPDWRSVLNSRADLGYPDFYPSRPGFGQPEDVLTEENVKNGFTGKAPVNVTAESFSMHGPVYQQLLAGGLGKLMDLGQEIIAKRNESMPNFQERAFRIPVRVTYNDTKRLQFLSDLANPAIPLARLMRNPVPHGFKGVDLLETMFSPPQPALTRLPAQTAEPRQPADPIPLDRAIWFIRVLGANEISAHRGRAQPVAAAVQAPSPVAATPSSTATAAPTPAPALNSNDWYTLEFTNTFTAWLRNQLAQLVLPTKQVVKPGVPLLKAAAGVLGDEKSRTRWLTKWLYSNNLLRELYRKRLLSPRLLVSWCADFLNTANLAQLGFITQLIADHLSDLADHVSISRHCVRAACIKINEIRAAPAKSTMAKVEEMLVLVVKALYTADPEVFLSPSTWLRHGPLLATLVDSTTPTFIELQRRNEALVFRPVTTDSGTSPRRQQMAEIQKLDSIGAATDMTALCKAYFSGPCAPTSPTIDVEKLEEKIGILLNWAMGLYQLGIHRPYAVYTILKKWLEWYEEQKVFTSSASTPGIAPFDIFPILYRWLDTSSAAQRAENVLPIGITFGELTRQGAFSYGRYIRTLIAMGHTMRHNQSTSEPRSHHLDLLCAMPIFVQAKDLEEQRRLALSGDDETRKRDQATEDAALETFREEIKEYVPEIFGLRQYGRSAMLRESIDHQLPSAAGITRYYFLQTRFWLSPNAVSHFKRIGSAPAMDASTFVRVLNIFHQCRGYSTIADFIIKGITQTEDEEILLIIIDCLKREADVWTSIDRWQQITDALMKRFHALRRKGRFFRPLSNLLLGLGHKGRLAAADVEKVRGAVDTQSNKTVALPTPAFHVDPIQSMDALRQIIIRGDTARAVAYAPKLFARHGPFTTWSVVWWQTIVQALLSSDPNVPSVVAAAIRHVGEVDQVAEDALAPVVANWLQGLSPTTRMDILGRRNTPPVVSFLLSLVVARRLGTLVILDFLVFPELKLAAGACSSSHPRLSSKRALVVDSAVTLMQQLLLCIAHKNLPPVNLRESFILQTARAKVFFASNVESLIRHLPDLVVLERAKLVPEKTVAKINNLLRSLGMTPQFKTAAFRHLDLLKDAFLSNEWIKRSNDPSLEAGMIDALKLIMADNVPGVKSVATLPALEKGARYSAWRWTRIVLEMRVEFKRLAMRISNNDEAMEARQTLSRLVRSSLDRDASADDIDLLCEAFRGADSVVGQEILSVGLDRLATLLLQLLGAEHQHQVEDTSLAVDLVLRVITSAGKQDKMDPATTAVRDRLFNLLTVAFQALERQVSGEDDVQLLPGATPPEPGDVLQVTLKLMRFVLAVPTPEVHLPTTTPRPDYALLAVAFLHLAVALCSRAVIYADLSSLRDLLVYLIDSAPQSTLTSIHLALAWEASTPSVQELVALHPSFATALPRPTRVVRAMALNGSHIVDDTDHGISLDDRPWEMLEQMISGPPAKRHGELFLTTRPMKDTASIPVSLFKPRLTRDEVPNAVLELDRPWEQSASERTLGNGFGGEPIAARQIATVLYARENPDMNGNGNGSSGTGGVVDDDIIVIPSVPQTPKARRLSVRIPPASASSSGPGSRPTGSGTTADPIAIDDGSDDDDDDDESGASAQPLAKRPRTGSKSTTANGNANASSSAATASRHVTSGKALPRKTTGGKGVARKATAGKTIRGTSTKGIKGVGRRKSVHE